LKSRQQQGIHKIYQTHIDGYPTNKNCWTLFQSSAIGF